MYSHQESLIVRTKYNVFCLFGAVRFHTALFASEPDIVNKSTGVPSSSIHWTEVLKQGKQANLMLRPSVPT